MGSARVAFVLLLLEERNFAEVGTFQPLRRSKPGCGLCPALSFKDLHHPCWGGGRGEPGPAIAWAGVPLLPPTSGGGNHPPALRRRRPPAMPGKANCCCPARVHHSILYPGDGGQPHRGVSQHVVRHEGGARVLGWSHSRFRGEVGSEDLPVRFGAASACWCGAGGQVDAAVGAEVVAAGEGFSTDEIVGVSCAPGLWLFGFNIWFLSPVRGHEREPPRRWRLPWGHRCCCRGRRRATRSLSSRRPSDVEVVHTRGSGTGVPFVMAP
jgi:hypothetical protein